MKVRLKRPETAVRIAVATLLFTGITSAVTTTPQHHKQLAVIAPVSNAISAHDAQLEERLRQQEAARVAAEQQVALQQAEAARLAQIKAARASRAPRIRPNPASYGNMPTISQADALGWCESGRRPDAVSKSGKYKGAFQFSYQTWNSTKYPEMSSDVTQVSYEDQRKVIVTKFPLRSWSGQFPVCSRKLRAAGVI